MTHSPLRQGALSRALWRLIFGAAVAGTIAISLSPQIPSGAPRLNDKVGHIVAYGVNGVLAAAAFPSVGGLRWALLGLLALGSSLEVAQGTLPEREASWLDAGANSLGLCGGVLLLYRRKQARAG